ncbi:MAG: site-2 protease family protein [Candidatus Zixiibacteriota bacterium]
MFDSNFLQMAATAGPVIIFSLIVHEFAHAWSALKFGDDTATRLGRLTINPLAHLDLMGSIVMVMSQFQFGWAKPVPVNLFNVKNYRVADFWISFAGPLSNIGMAIVAAMAFRAFSPAPESYVWHVLYFGVVINLVLALFNMIPLFPLDGSHMLRSALPREYEEPLARFERVAPMVLIGLIILPRLLPGIPDILRVFLTSVIRPVASFLIY